ncbi:hypothetical protein [Streptomyces achromogenes]|uniref:hypothetical protein n=1 Tax=Streptomyces achromogenes TaxID=67255 RepID=UPI003688523E
MRLRQNFSKGMAVAAAATGMLSLYSGSAFAHADGQNTAHSSPGSLAEISVQDPVIDSVDLCDDHVSAAAALDTVSASFCAAEAQGTKGEEGRRHHGESGDAAGPRETGGNNDSGYGDRKGPSGHLSASSSFAAAEIHLSLYGDDETAPPSYGDDETAPPSYGGEETAPPAHGDEETAPPSYGDQETAPPPHGDEETTPPPSGGEDHPGQPPMLAQTGGEEQTMIASSAAGAALIATGTILYRRGRAAARR